MSTKREQILVAIKTALDSVSEAGGAYRSRVQAFTRSQNEPKPVIVVEPVSDTPDPSMVGAINWSLLVRVAVIARGAVPDQLADPVVGAVNAALLADKSLGGLSMDIEPASVTFEILNGDQPVGVVSLGYKVDYRTTATNLSS